MVVEKDIHEGHGGSYHIDENGKKTLVERTQDSAEVIARAEEKKQEPKKKK